MSKSTAYRVLTEDLGLHAFKLETTQVLSPAAKQKRHDRCNGLLRNYEERWDLILWSDEKTFTVAPTLNKQNDRVWAKNKEDLTAAQRSVSREMKPSSIMVWAGITADHKTRLIVLPAGAKINSEIYQQIILPEVRRFCIAHPGTIFQQDGAPAHASHATQKWLTRELINFISKDDWPPYSPDCTPLDFFVWNELERIMGPQREPNVDSLERAVRRAWTRLDQDAIRRACMHAAPNRLRLVVQEEGGPIEHLL